MFKRFDLSPARLSLLALALLTASATASAQPPGFGQRGHDGARHHGPPGAEQQLARLDEALDLSDEQAAQLLEVLQTTEAERQALHERVMAEFRPEFCALMEETDSGILALLTPEQAATFDQLKAERRERAGGRWGRGMPGLDCEAAGG